MSPAICSIGEAIERHVAIERVDHPVAVLPHHPRQILLEAVRIGVARQIEPRPRPALAVVRRREQPIDEPWIGRVLAVARGVGQRPRPPPAAMAAARSDRARRGARASRAALRATASALPFRAAPGRNDRSAFAPSRPLRTSGSARTRRPAIGPVLGLPGRALRRRGHLPLAGRRPRGALIDPGANQRDLRGRQRVAVLRHPVVAVEAEHAANDQALLAVARDDRPAPVSPPFIAAARESRRRSALRFLRAVALVAVGSGGSAGCRERSRPGAVSSVGFCA